jgi:energy-coupling factor transport system ATP-binding protein
MEEAALADRVIIMDDGVMRLDGTPEEVFAHSEELKEMNLDVPLAVELADRLRRRGVNVPADIITVEKMVEYLCQYK